MNSKKVVLFIIILGLFLRLFNVANNPPSLYWDEASIGYEAFSIANTGKDMHGNSWLQPILPAYGDYKAPIYIWLAALTMKILPASELAVRLPSVIFGTLTLLLVYLLAKELFPKNTHLPTLSALMMAISPWHIHFSRVGFEANVGLFWLTLGALLLLKSRENGKLALAAAIAGIIGVYSYFSIRIVFPLISLVILIIYARKFKKQLIWIASALVLFLLLLQPLLKSTFYTPANQFRLTTDNIFQSDKQIIYSNTLREEDGNTLWSRIIHHRYLYTAKEFLNNFNDHLTFRYLFLSGDLNPRHSSGISGIILPSLAPIFLVGLYHSLKNKKTFIILIVWWFVSLIPASIPQETPHALRSLNAVPIISIILGIGAHQLLSWRKDKKIHNNFLAAYLLLIAINVFTFFYYYQKAYPHSSNVAWQDGYRQLAQYLNSQEENYDQIVVSNKDRLFLYILFYTQFDPQKLHLTRQQKLSQNPFDFHISKFGKYSFRQIIWENEATVSSRTLIASIPDKIPKDVKRKALIKDINGEIVFEIVDMGDYR